MIQPDLTVSVVVRSSTTQAPINTEVDLDAVFAKLVKKWERNPRALCTTLNTLTSDSPFGKEINDFVIKDLIECGIFCRKHRCLTCDRDQLRSMALVLNA